MAKYLSVPDFHFSPKWAEVSTQVGAAILKAAKDNHVDFIAFVGDGHNEPIIATNKGGLNTLRAIIRPLVAYCPVVAIEGTPSHDGPGCYGPWEDLGVTLLKPNHTYGFIKSQGIFDTAANKLPPECVLFGVPELSKKHVQAQLSLSSGDATKTTLEYFKEYVASYIAPMRLKYNSVPAYGFLHGNISDSKQENSNDKIMRESDLVIYTEDLRIANLTRWEFGHIHTPWESQVINGGYAGFTGIDSNSWGKRDFVPAMHILDDGIVKRIPYGTPMRVKITEPFEDKKMYDKDVAYWLYTKDPKATLPMDLVHKFSRVTYNESTTVTRRVSEEEAKSVKTLSDLLTLLDPNASAKSKEFIDSIPVYKIDNKLDVNVKLEELEVRGCKFFGGKTIKFNLADLPNTVTSIFGDNGSGKSSLLSFCTPYPVIVGKDTQNRTSAIKEFFTQKDSSIRKVFTVNGEKHEHLINIKGAHTKSAKNECYLTINGVAQLENGSFDEMFEMCEKLYGSFNDYVLTSFYVQPLQSDKLSSGLMSASLKDVRNLVQNIAGIYRSKEKAYALSQALELSNKKVELENKIIGAEENLKDIASLEAQHEEIASSLLTSELSLKDILAKGKELNKKVSELTIKKTANDLLIAQQSQDLNSIKELLSKQNSMQLAIADIQTLANKSADIKAKIEQNSRNYEVNNSIQVNISKNSVLQNEYNKTKRELESKLQAKQFEFNASCNKIRQANDESQRDYVNKSNKLSDAIRSLNTEYRNECDRLSDCCSKMKGEYETKKQRLANDIENQELNIKSYEKQIQIANKPCSECGHIEEDLQTTIDLNNGYIKGSREDIEQLKEELNNLIPPIEYVKPDQSPLIAQYRAEYNNLVKPLDREIPTTNLEIENLKQAINNLATPTYLAVPEMKYILSDAELTGLQKQLSDIALSSSRVAEYQANIDVVNSQIKELQGKQYDIDTVIDFTIANATTELQLSRDRYTQLVKDQSSLQADLKNVDAIIEEQKEMQKNIDNKRLMLDTIKSDWTTWDYVAKMLNSNKIPALELEMMLSSIDAEATRIISDYQLGRFTFETVTQNDNSTDKFDILVFDSETGDKRSFLKFSPGQKAFFTDAYTKALVRERNTNGTRVYSPVVMDESDGPLQPELVGAYYEIQKNYWNLPVLAVSHSTASHEFIDNRVNVVDLIEK